MPFTNIAIYTGRLTFPVFSIPGGTTAPIDGSQPVVIQLLPGTYEFSQAPGVAAFSFEVTPTGTVDYDPGFDGFLAGRGTTQLSVYGHPVELDATYLSHDLLPIIHAASDIYAPREFSRQWKHWLHLVPADYGFVPAAGIVADFQMSLRPDGSIVIDPVFGGFAGVSDKTLIIKGYPVTIDARGLVEDLILVSMTGPVDPLPHAVVNVRTFIPAAGYLVRSVGASATEFRLAVTTAGAVLPA